MGKSSTSFKPGNKAALGNTGGRPRTACPEKEELIELGEDLVQWATEPTEEVRFRFPEWYALKHRFTEAVFDLMKRKPEFMPFYEIARASLAKKLLNGTIKESIGHRFLRIYCPEVRQEEDERIQMEIKLKAQESKPPHDQTIDVLLDTIKSLKDAK